MTRYSKRRVGETAKDLILANFSVEEVVRLVREMIEGCQITAKCVYTYRKELRKEGYVL